MTKGLEFFNLRRPNLAARGGHVLPGSRAPRRVAALAFAFASPPLSAMDSPNLSELNFERSGSRLLSESSLTATSSTSSLSRTGPGGDDLSLSELSLSERPQPPPSRRPKFSLLAQPLPQKVTPHPEDSAIAEEYADGDAEGELEHTMTQEDVERSKKLAARTREEKLQHDLFILKKLNSAFEVYKEALKEAKSGTEVCHLTQLMKFIDITVVQRVAEQLKNTDALLNKYVNILSKTEDAARLIVDERWQGAEAVGVASFRLASQVRLTPGRTRSFLNGRTAKE